MAQRHTIRSQGWSVSSAGPFAAALAAASNLSVGSGIVVFFFSLAHLTASARFRAGPLGVRIRPVMRDGCLEGATIVSRFPVAFPLPAFAFRSSDARRGVGLSSRSAYRPEGRTSTGLPLSARSSCGRGGCLLYPEDGGAPPGRGTCSVGACRSAAASPSTPLQTHPREALSYEASVGGLGSSPVRPAPRL